MDLLELSRARGLSLREARKELEHSAIETALREVNGNVSAAARALGIKRSRLSQIVNASPRLLQVREEIHARR